MSVIRLIFGYISVVLSPLLIELLYGVTDGIEIRANICLRKMMLQWLQLIGTSDVHRFIDRMWARENLHVSRFPLDRL